VRPFVPRHRGQRRPLPHYRDRSAGVLDVHTREGNGNQDSFRQRIQRGLRGARSFCHKKRGSWVVSAPELPAYLFAHTLPDASYVFGFEHAQARLTYDLTPKNKPDALRAGRFYLARPPPEPGQPGDQCADQRVLSRRSGVSDGALCRRRN
jgi:hypothetical protein